MNFFKDYPQARKIAYLVYALIGVVIGSLSIGYAAAQSIPEWLNIATQVFAYLGVALGLTASANVPTPPHA